MENHKQIPLGATPEWEFLETCKIPGKPNALEIKSRKSELRGAIGRHRRAKMHNRFTREWESELKRL